MLYGAGNQGGTLRADRLRVILNSAMGRVAQTSDAFVDFDSIPEDGVSLAEALSYLVSKQVLPSMRRF